MVDVVQRALLAHALMDAARNHAGKCSEEHRPDLLVIGDQSEALFVQFAAMGVDALTDELEAAIAEGDEGEEGDEGATGEGSSSEGSSSEGSSSEGSSSEGSSSDGVPAYLRGRMLPDPVPAVGPGPGPESRVPTAAPALRAPAPAPAPGLLARRREADPGRPGRAGKAGRPRGR